MKSNYENIHPCNNASGTIFFRLVSRPRKQWHIGFGYQITHPWIGVHSNCTTFYATFAKIQKCSTAVEMCNPRDRQSPLTKCLYLVYCCWDWTWGPSPPFFENSDPESRWEAVWTKMTAKYVYALLFSVPLARTPRKIMLHPSHTMVGGKSCRLL